MIVMILVAPKAGAQHEFLFNKLASALFAKHVSPTNVTPQSVAIITHLSVLILVTPKAGAMHDLLLKELALEVLVKAEALSESMRQKQKWLTETCCLQHRGLQ
jgi:hypothetical protein